MNRWTLEDVEAVERRRVSRQNIQAAPAPKRKEKYRNERVMMELGPSGQVINGHLRLVWEFHSLKEAGFVRELILRQRAGDIRDLRLQEPFALQAIDPDGRPVLIGEWFADAVYVDTCDGARHVCDAKGFRTKEYKLKKKIVEANYRLRIEEI